MKDGSLSLLFTLWLFQINKYEGRERERRKDANIQKHLLPRAEERGGGKVWKASRKGDTDQKMYN